MRATVRVSAALFLWVVAPSPGQDTTVAPPPLKVRQLCGQVVVGKAYYVPYAQLELRRKPDTEPLMTVRADAEGKFFFQGVKKGEYWLVARIPETAIENHFPVRVTKESSVRVCQQEIEISVCGLECQHSWIKLRKRGK